MIVRGAGPFGAIEAGLLDRYAGKKISEVPAADMQKIAEHFVAVTQNPPGASDKIYESVLAPFGPPPGGFLFVRWNAAERQRDWGRFADQSAWPPDAVLRKYPVKGQKKYKGLQAINLKKIDLKKAVRWTGKNIGTVAIVAGGVLAATGIGIGVGGALAAAGKAAQPKPKAPVPQPAAPTPIEAQQALAAQSAQIRANGGVAGKPGGGVVGPVAGAAAGFLVGGPIGAVAGGAAGYFFTKPQAAPPMAGFGGIRRRRR